MTTRTLQLTDEERMEVIAALVERRDSFVHISHLNLEARSKMKMLLRIIDNVAAMGDAEVDLAGENHG